MSTDNIKFKIFFPEIYAYQNESQNFEMFMAEHLGQDGESRAGSCPKCRADHVIKLTLDS